LPQIVVRDARHRAVHAAAAELNRAAIPRGRQRDGETDRLRRAAGVDGLQPAVDEAMRRRVLRCGYPAQRIERDGRHGLADPVGRHGRGERCARADRFRQCRRVGRARLSVHGAARDAGQDCEGSQPLHAQRNSNEAKW
jgi:hypothetical protein